MISEFIECEADRNANYCKVIQTKMEYRDGRRFPIDEVVTTIKKIDLNATERNEIGGLYVSTPEFVLRWLIRGDTLCEVKIPEDAKIYRTSSVNGIYIAEKIILTNPVSIDDDLAMKLYLGSKLPEEAYPKAMIACAICGHINTALKICEDKVNKSNIEMVLKDVYEFCERRDREYWTNTYELDTVKILREKLNNIKG